MVIADFPSDAYLSVYIVEDTEPPCELAYYQLRNDDTDPSVGTTLVDDGTRVKGVSERALRHMLLTSVPLTTACDAAGNLIYANKLRQGFALSLTRWMHDPRRLRVVVLTQIVLRFAEFTLEQQRIWEEMIKKVWLGGRHNLG